MEFTIRHETDAQKSKAIRPSMLFLAGVLAGAGLVFGLTLLTVNLPLTQMFSSESAAQPIIKQAPRDVTVAFANVQVLVDVMKERPRSIRCLLLTPGGSTIELNNGICLFVATLERQAELMALAKDSGISFAEE